MAGLRYLSVLLFLHRPFGAGNQFAAGAVGSERSNFLYAQTGRRSSVAAVFPFTRLTGAALNEDYTEDWLDSVALISNGRI